MMKKLICFTLCLYGFMTVAYSQSSMEERLKNNVYTLAADSMIGRKAGSEFARNAAKYIAAQWEEIVFGVTANYGSNYHHYTADTLDGKSKVFAWIGLNGQLNMKYFALRPGVHYEYADARHPEGNMSTHGITVPFDFVLQTPQSIMGGFDVFVGPYYNYKFAGKQGNAPLDFKNYSNREETGLHYGIEIKVGYIRIGFARRTAFTNFTQSKNADGAHLRNRASHATLGFTFWRIAPKGLRRQYNMPNNPANAVKNPTCVYLTTKLHQ